jgi:hypothetical protein
VANPGKVPAPTRQPAPVVSPANPVRRQPGAGPVERGTAERGNTVPRVARGAAPEVRVPAPAPANGRKAVEGVERGRPAVPEAKPASEKERRDRDEKRGEK